MSRSSLRLKASASTLRGLYKDIDAFEISRKDARAVRRSRGADTYGELQPTATLKLLEYLKLRRRDVFVDLGSGAGKVALAAAMYTNVGRARGIELSEERHALACEARDRAVARRLMIASDMAAATMCAPACVCSGEPATSAHDRGAKRHLSRVRRMAHELHATRGAGMCLRSH